jgi:SPP1 gp7 family putative phage head morphogenesis protein
LPTLNEKLLERAIRHALFLVRLRNGEAARQTSLLEQRLLDKVFERYARDVAVVKARGQRVSLKNSKRLREMMAWVARTSGEEYRELRRTFEASLRQIAKMEGRFQLNVILGEAAKPISQQLAPIMSTARATVLARIVQDTTIQGDFLLDHYDRLGRNLTTRVRQAVQVGLANGDSTNDLVRRLRTGPGSVFGKSRRELQSIVRTSVTSVTSAAREEFFAQNTDVVKGVKYVATLDARTTDICASLDGRVFPVAEGERPPMHHQCRSTTVPVVAGLDEIPGFDASRVPEATRASLDGQVPESLTYGQWLRTQPQAIQLEALGRGRYELFRQGVPIDRFVDDQFRSLTLDQILAREGLAA